MWFIAMFSLIVLGLLLVSFVCVITQPIPRGSEFTSFGNTLTDELDPTVEFGDSKNVPEDD